MTDVTQGADAPDEHALFREATDSPTLEEFENPNEPTEQPADKPTTTEKPAEPDKPQERDEPQIPAGRLREENEARRRAERERDELAARLATLSRPQQQEQKKPDVFEDASGFVQAEVKPLIEQFRQELQMQRESYSMDMAAQRFGPETVVQSRQALEVFMQRGDPLAWAVYNRAMQSHDPYGVIAGWYHDRATLHEIGGDLKTYRQKLLDEAISDPEYRKKVLESTKSQAKTNGAFVNQPVASTVPKMPSLGNIGAAGGDSQVTEPSDLELFRAATSAKRR